MRSEFTSNDVGQLEALLDHATKYYRSKGYSTREAYSLAVEAVCDKTGFVPTTPRDYFDGLFKSAFGDLPYGSSRWYTEAPFWRTSRRSTRTSARTKPSDYGKEFDHMFQNESNRNSAWKSGNSRSGSSEHSASRTRSSETKHGGHRYESSRRYTREELLAIEAKIYVELIEKGVRHDEARWEARNWFERHKDCATNSSSRNSSSDNSSNGPRTSRGSRARGPSSYGSKHPNLNTFFGVEPYEYVRCSSSSRHGPRNYRTEERRPGGAFSDNYSGYNGRSDWSSSSRPPPTQPSGVKPDMDLYELLGISKSATVAEMKQAQRKLCIKHHPDRAQGGTAAEKAATEKMAQINQACDVLKDKDMRAFYDRTGLIASMGESPDV